ncbi:MAG: site-2 protease family protein [Candidatus Dormibacter sp.]
MILDVVTGIAAVILVLLVVVLVHEGGHFVLAKWAGVRVDEFAFGFGPRLWAHRRGETTYSLRAIPAGGYVKMAGMLGLEGEADAGERNFYRASIPKRMMVILAGIVANMVLAGLLFTVYFATPTGSHLLPGEAAKLAGLRDGDSIISVDGRPVRHDNAADVATDLHAATAASQGRPMLVVFRGSNGDVHSTIKASLVINDGYPTPVAVTNGAVALPPGMFVVTAINGQPVASGDPAHLLGSAAGVLVDGFVISADGTAGASLRNVAVSGVTSGDGAADALQAAWRLGVEPDFAGEPVMQSLGDGFGQIPSFVHDTAVGLYDLVTNPKLGGVTGPQGLSGPVGIATQTVTQAHRGTKNLLYWIAFISMNLGLVNVLPIPFLDGGKFMLILIEAVRRRRLDPRREALIYAISLAIVVVFVIYVTIGDVGRSL